MNDLLSKVIAYIGDGEGKTSAALGHAIRVAGHDKQVAIVQFLKGLPSGGEYRYLSRQAEKNSLIEIHLCGDRSFFLDPSQKHLHSKKAKEGLLLAQKLVASDKYFLVVMDEIFDALTNGLIDISDVELLIDTAKSPTRKAPCHLILTGRILPSAVSRKIDLVTQMKKIKHYFDLGDKGIKGLDW